MIKYVFYEGDNGDVLFTREEYVKKNPKLLDPFKNKKPVKTFEAEDDNSAISMFNDFANQRAMSGKK